MHVVSLPILHSPNIEPIMVSFLYRKNKRKKMWCFRSSGMQSDRGAKNRGVLLRLTTFQGFRYDYTTGAYTCTLHK